MQVKTIVGAAMLVALAAPEAHAQSAAASAWLRPSTGQTVSAANTTQRPTGWTPSVTAVESYTDNVALTADNRKGDFLTQLALGIEGAYNGPRLQGSLNASAGYNLYANTSNLNGWSFSGYGTGAYTIVPGTLAIEADGQILNRTVTTFRQSAIDRTTPQDRIQVSTLSAGPHLTMPLGTLADLDLITRMNAVTYTPADGSSTIAVPRDSTYGEAYGILTTGTRLDRLELELTGGYLKDNSDFTQTSGSGTVYYAVTPGLRVFGRVGQDKVEDANIVDISATTWSVGSQIRAPQGSYLSIEGGRRYDRPWYNVDSLLQVSQRLHLTATYRERLQPPQVTQGRGLVAFGNQPPRPPSGAPNLPLVDGILIDETTYQKDAQAHVIYTWPQQTLDLAVIWNDNELLESNRRYRILSAYATWRRQLRVDLVAELQARYYRNQTDVLIDRDRGFGGEANLIYALRPTTHIRVGYAYFNDKQLAGQRLRIYENVISIAIQKQF